MNPDVITFGETMVLFEPEKPEAFPYNNYFQNKLEEHNQMLQ
jgi:hypothetical protein